MMSDAPLYVRRRPAAAGRHPNFKTPAALPALLSAIMYGMQYTIRRLMLFTACAAGIAGIITQRPPIYLTENISAQGIPYMSCDPNPRFWLTILGELVVLLVWLGLRRRFVR